MNYKNQRFTMNEVRNVFSKVCLSCVLIVIAIVSVVSLAVIAWTQVI